MLACVSFSYEEAVCIQLLSFFPISCSLVSPFFSLPLPARLISASPQKRNCLNVSLVYNTQAYELSFFPLVSRRLLGVHLMVGDRELEHF